MLATMSMTASTRLTASLPEWSYSLSDKNICNRYNAGKSMQFFCQHRLCFLSSHQTIVQKVRQTKLGIYSIQSDPSAHLTGYFNFPLIYKTRSETTCIILTWTSS